MQENKNTPYNNTTPYKNTTAVEHEFRIFGLRRGGNHAIIGWLASAMPDDSVYFFNDVSCDYTRLYNTILIGPTDYKAGTVASKLIRNPKWDVNKKCIIQSYEDQPLDIVNQVNLQDNGVVKNKVNILILRDPFNMVASRLELYRKGNYFVEVTPEVMELWETYANEFLGETSILSDNHDNNLSNDIKSYNDIKTVLVNYNKWHSDHQYRTLIAQQIGIDPNLANINCRMFFGGGSSFNNVSTTKNPEQSATDQTKQLLNRTNNPQKSQTVNDENNSETIDDSFNRRWEKFQEDPEFQKWVYKEKYLKLCENIFGKI